MEKKKLLYIDCLIREEKSRTKLIADAFFSVIDKNKYEIETVKLDNSKFCPLDKEKLKKRETLVSERKYDDKMLDCAKQFASSDVIVIAAPFWDLSFPAILKVYIENITVCGITFETSDHGIIGLCNAQKLLYITTRGGYYNDTNLEQGSRYIEAISKFYGIKEYQCISKEGLDIIGNDEKKLVEEACIIARKTAESLNISLT